MRYNPRVIDRIATYVAALLFVITSVIFGIVQAASAEIPLGGSGQAPSGDYGKDRAGSGARNMYVDKDAGLPKSDNPGRDLYQNACSTCHGSVGQGTPEAPPLIGVGEATVDFYLSTGRMPLDHPRPQAPRGPQKVSDEQRAAIVRYVASLSDGPSTPHVDPSKGDLAEGNRLYANNCASCHNSQGSGGALLAGYSAPAIFDANTKQIAQAIRVGPGAMPAFGPQTFDDAQMNSLVRYVEHLQKPDNRGGLPIGSLGPVAEGFIAWIVGLGALLGFTRWIGTRV